MHPALPFTVAALLFAVGVYGVLVRRNAVLLLMAVELMLNAVNLIFVTADAAIRAAVPRAGQSFTLFVIVLAAAEIGVGLALILQLYRLRRTVTVDDLPLGDTGPTPPDDGSLPDDRGGATGRTPPDGGTESGERGKASGRTPPDGGTESGERGKVSGRTPPDGGTESGERGGASGRGGLGGAVGVGK